MSWLELMGMMLLFYGTAVYNGTVTVDLTSTNLLENVGLVYPGVNHEVSIISDHEGKRYLANDASYHTPSDDPIHQFQAESKGNLCSTIGVCDKPHLNNQKIHPDPSKTSCEDLMESGLNAKHSLLPSVHDGSPHLVNFVN